MCTTSRKSMILPEKNGDVYHDFCIQDAQYHLDKAKSILEEGLKDPQQYYADSYDHAKVLYNSLPFIILTQQLLFHKPSGDTEESLPSTPYEYL